MAQNDSRSAAAQRKARLNATVTRHWPRSSWSNIDPQVIDTAKADVGVGLALYYRPKGEAPLVVLMKAAGQDKYQIPGGFMDLSPTGDTTPQLAVARETVEELVYPDGSPVLPFATLAKRLASRAPLDFNKISVGGQPRIVSGFACPLTAREFAKISAYNQQLQHNPDLRQQMCTHTKGEIDGIGVFPLAHIQANPALLRHIDQASLFAKLGRHLNQPAP